jgi:excinuclease ABC subunit C
MMGPFDQSRLSGYPDLPGVYLMKDEQGEVLYVGKAKSLKVRLKQYYAPHSSDERVQIPALLAKVVDIETIMTSSETEALQLEATLIKRFKPRYNVLLKDDKSHLLLRIGLEHAWPRIDFVRAKDASGLPPRVFGPYAGHRSAQALFDLVVRLFLVRQCSDEAFRRRKAPCLLYQMRRCTAPCVGKVSHEEYDRQVTAAIEFLSGKTEHVRSMLHEEMERASEALAFETAARLHRSLELLDSVVDVAHEHMNSGATDTDVIGYCRDNDRFALAILHYRESTLVYGESWIFQLEHAELDSEYLQQLLVQYYLRRGVVDSVPKEILLPEGHWSLEALGELVRRHFGRRVELRRPKRGAKQGLVDLACDNAHARLSQDPGSTGYVVPSLESVQRLLCLTRFPRIIDCFDASHFGGKGLVASCVGFVDGKPASSRYRTFHIRSVHVGNDLAMLQEAVTRRYRDIDVSSADELPDLILVDGGQEQLLAVEQALDGLSLFDVDVAALAKEHGRHDKGMTAEVIFTPKHPPLRLPIMSRELLLLQAIRDEAHRFTIGFQKKRRVKETFHSQLESIPGIGPQKRKALLMAFSGVEAIRAASIEELHQRAKLSLKDASRVLTALNHH